MLEHSYAESNVAALGTSDGNNVPAKKKRKLEGTPDDDEDEYYGSGPKGKKPKGGIGYAGAVKEDVRPSLAAHRVLVTIGRR